MPPRLGSLRLMGYRTGSVTDVKKRTIALYGSGFTQEITALAIIIHIYKVNPISIILATAARKFPITNIVFTVPS